MSAAKKLFCANPDCGQSLLSTFTSCPNCGSTSFLEAEPRRAPALDEPRHAFVLPAQSQPASVGPGGAHRPQVIDASSAVATPTAAQPTKMRACAACGAPLNSKALVCLACGAAVSDAPRLDMRPRIERNASNIVSKTEAERDRIYDTFLAACDAEGVEGMVLKSGPFIPTAWVSCECWMPHERDNRLRERVSAVLTIRGREYHRFEYEIDIDITRGNETRKDRSIIVFTGQTARTLVQYLLRRTESCDFQCCRTAPFQFWLPRNKVSTPVDPLTIVGGVSSALGVAMLVIATAVSSPSLSVVGFACFVVAGGSATWLVLRRKQLYVVSTGKPAEEPRKLLRMDSWQTLVNDLGNEADKVKAEIKAAMRVGQGNDTRVADEKIWYRGVDGKEEREQIVVTFRRAIAFIHVYTYGNDLFVGWDAHLNGGTWIETRVGFGRDPQTKSPCQLNSIAAGWHTPNEYDVNDTETLVERVHAAVTQVVKRAMADRKIDQDIDFKIVRGARQGLVGHADIAPSKTRSSPKREG